VRSSGSIQEELIIMNAGEAVKALRARISVRSTVLSVVVGGVVLVPILWSVRQARLTDEALSRAIAAEKAAAQAQTGVDRSRALENDQIEIKRDSKLVRSSRRPTKADAERAKQLSDEIAGLSEIQNKIDNELYELRAKAAEQARNPRPSYPLP
jgi:hypothetical protein